MRYLALLLLATADLRFAPIWDLPVRQAGCPRCHTHQHAVGDGLGAGPLRHSVNKEPVISDRCFSLNVTDGDHVPVAHQHIQSFAHVAV